ARTRKFGEALEVEKRGGGCGNEGCVRGGSNTGHFLEQSNVLRMAAELEISDQGAERSATKGAVLFFIDLLEDRALVELDRLVKVFEQIGLADIQQLDLETARSFRLLDEIVQSAPRAFQLLERLSMQHLG